MQIEAPDLARADVDVVGTSQVRGIGRTQEAKTVRQRFQRTVAEDALTFSGLILKQREDQLMLAQPVGALDVVGDGHVKKLAYVECFEFG